MNKRIIKYVLVTLILSISIILLDIITVRYDCNYLGNNGPCFYGFPFKYRATTPWVSSMSIVYYISGFLGNTLFFFMAILPSVVVLNRVTTNLTARKIFKIVGYTLICISLVMASLNLILTAPSFEWKNSNFENYEDKHLSCNKHYEFFFVNKQ